MYKAVLLSIGEPTTFGIYANLSGAAVSDLARLVCVLRINGKSSHVLPILFAPLCDFSMDNGFVFNYFKSDLLQDLPLSLCEFIVDRNFFMSNDKLKFALDFECRETENKESKSNFKAEDSETKKFAIQNFENHKSQETKIIANELQKHEFKENKARENSLDFYEKFGIYINQVLDSNTTNVKSTKSKSMRLKKLEYKQPKSIELESINSKQIYSESKNAESMKFGLMKSSKNIESDFVDSRFVKLECNLSLALETIAYFTPLQAVYYSRGVGSLSAIKLTHVFLHSLSLSTQISIYATNSFYFSRNKEIKAFANMSFFLDSKEHLTLTDENASAYIRLDKSKQNFKLHLPYILIHDDFSEPCTPLYVTPAV